MKLVSRVGTENKIPRLYLECMKNIAAFVLSMGAKFHFAIEKRFHTPSHTLKTDSTAAVTIVVTTEANYTELLLSFTQREQLLILR